MGRPLYCYALDRSRSRYDLSSGKKDSWPLVLKHVLEVMDKTCTPKNTRDGSYKTDSGPDFALASKKRATTCFEKSEEFSRSTESASIPNNPGTLAQELASGKKFG